MRAVTMAKLCIGPAYTDFPLCTLVVVEVWTEPRFVECGNIGG